MLIKTILIVLSISLFCIAISTFMALFFMTRNVKASPNDLRRNSPSVEMRTVNNNVIDFLSLKHKYTEFEDISPNIINAFISLEDKRFYKHNGLDYYRLLGALIKDIKVGYFKEGGSTITQQLAKNTVLSNEKSIKRKINEAKLAFDIEKDYDKEDIIEMYLNAIYFGNGLYGITSACEKLFCKSPSEINVAEGAILASIVNNPKRNSPLNNIENSTNRRNLVLKLMLEQGYIDENQFDIALEYKFDIEKISNKKYNYTYTNNVLEEASKILNLSEKDLLNEKIIITTYMDDIQQKNLENLFNSNEFLPNENYSYGSVIADNKTSGVSACVGNFNNSIFNLRRNPASTIKPFISYAPALESNYIYPDGLVLDEKTNFNGYEPKNYGDGYLGWIDYRTALAKSQNIPSVRLVNELSVDYCKNIARKCGLTFTDNDFNLSIALGGLNKGNTLMELTSAYMTLANQGEYSNLTFIKEIKTKSNKVLYTHKNDKYRAISKENAYLLTDMLMDTVKYGTASKLSSLPFDVASKTGTNSFSKDKNNDAWNVSYTNNNTVCVWYGNLSNKEETALSNNITGGSYPTLLARHIYQTLPSDNFEIPDGIIQLDIDTYTSEKYKEIYLASELTPDFYRKSCLFNINNLPKLISDTFDKIAPNDFYLNMENGNVDIKFMTSKNLVYKIYMSSLFGEPILIDNYVSTEDGVYENNFRPNSVGIVKFYIEVSDNQNNFAIKTQEKTLFLNKIGGIFDGIFNQSINI